MDFSWDCIVVGGGAAGLSAALVLGRARRRTLLIDAGHQSNLAAHGIGGLLGHDGRAPAELYEMGRGELAAYPSVEARTGEVTSGEQVDGGFLLELADGARESARRVVLAPGMDYRPPALPGLADLWGRSVFHCPFCHGWELRDEPLAVLANGDVAVHKALLLRGWSSDVVLLTDGPADLTDSDRARLAAEGIAVDERPVSELVASNGELAQVAFADGTRLARRGLLVLAPLHPRSALTEQLGTAPGVFAAGDVSAEMPSVAGAIAAGSQAAAAVVHSLVADMGKQSEAQQVWEQHYAERERVWSGRANVRLVEQAESLSPGRVLDLGCGEGGDAIWLAEHGWQVTAVDISQTALDRAAADAKAHNVSESIDFQRHDLPDTFPAGSFDLVSAHFLHSMAEMDRPKVLRLGADAVATGGILLIVDHAGPPPWASKLHHHHEFPSADEVVESLNLDATEWERVRVEAVGRAATGPNGEVGTLVDNVIVLRRAG